MSDDIDSKAAAGSALAWSASWTLVKMASLIWEWTGETGRAWPCSTAAFRSEAKAYSFWTWGSSYAAAVAGGAADSRKFAFWTSGPVAKLMNAAAPSGFLENAEMARLMPPSTLAGSPPSKLGKVVMSKSSAIFDSLPSAYAYGQLRMKVALPFSNARRDSSSMYVVTARGAAPS